MKIANPTILVVDDSSLTRSMIMRVLALTEIPIGPLLQASDGKAGLAILEAQDVHLVLADINMPVMDGLTMITEMRRSERLKNIPVIVISAQPDEEQIENLKAAGVCGYLPKPFTPEGVRQAIAPVLEMIETEDEPEMPGVPAQFNMNLAEALSEALETMAFISPEMAEAADVAEARDLRLARVRFHGVGFHGSLSLSAPRGFGMAVARNCALSDAETQSDDALKELANVTCGLFLRKRIGGATGFVLAPPVLTASETSADESEESDCVLVKAEGFVVAAHVTPEGEQADAQ